MAAAFLALAAPAWGASPAPAWSARVANVHDGDTLGVWLRSGPRRGELARVRLHCADTPELAVKGRWPEQATGPQARQITAALTEGRTVRIRVRGRSYQRLVADVTLADGRDLAEALVAAGLAWVDERYCRTPRLLRLQAEASFWGVGLWGDRGARAPWAHRRQRGTGR
ncbi:MAG: thermonuclease family protein [Desulfarculus sp.]|nr:thermonuclease family protein [Desulfarculus sp.]